MGCLTVLFPRYGRLRAGSKALALGLFAAFPLAAEPVTVLALGDSLTQGYGLVQNDGFVPVMEGWLRARGHEVALINAGVSGDTTAGGASRIAWSLTDEVDAVIVALGGNDLLRGIEPAQTRANLDAILAETTGRGLPTLLVGMAATGNFGASYKAAFDALYPELAAAYGLELFPHFLLGLEELGDRAAVLRDYMQSDATHPNAEGVRLIVARMGPAVEALVEAAER